MTRETFDRIASGYDQALPPHITEHYLRKRVAFIREHCKQGRLIDVGCGTGRLAGRLAEAGFEVTGVDGSEGMLGVMRAEVPGVRGIFGDATDLPFENDEFDVAVSVAVLHHLALPEAVASALREMVRVVRPGGRVVIWDHNPLNPYWRSLMKRVPQDDGSERLVAEREIVGVLRAAGAEIYLSVRTGFMPEFIPPRAASAVRAGERLAESIPGLRRLAAHNVVVAEPR